MIENIEKKVNNKKEELQKRVLLLENPENKRSFDVINRISPNNKDHNLLEKAEKERIKENLHQELITKYRDTNFYTHDEIMQECLKFDLYFSKSSNFEGELSLDFGKKIDSFMKENNLLVSDGLYDYNIYFLTPRPFTKRYTDSSYSDTSSLNGCNSNIKNPLAFLKVEEKGESYYILIDGNKSYKTIGNRLKGLMFYNRNYMRFMWSLLVLLPLSVLSAFLTYSSYYAYTVIPFLVLYAISYGVGSLLTGIFGYTPENDSLYNKRIFNEKYYYAVKKPSTEREMMFLLILSLSISYNAKVLYSNYLLRDYGNVYKTFVDETTVGENEVKSKGFVYNFNKKYYKNTTRLITISPGRFFPEKTKTVVNEEYKYKDQ